ncbi:hypothetical protein [Clostridium intestinale]|uniref:Uncharacterized protein n=1 Tax=Clostridium intestinale DSM 6191 TaxID=1121320 RepID=A0A1M5ZV75_9CLOT|nr:hypothetical protein [Clostridium intestinale]SHI28122.1 hypothetical protein SAMN02745941_03446 [Clostridium intestinale DSM 6191]
MEKDKKNNNEEKKQSTQLPALFYLSLGVILYFSGKMKNDGTITVESGIGILLLAIGAVKVVLYFIKKKKTPKVEEVKEPVIENKNNKNNKKGKKKNK